MFVLRVRHLRNLNESMKLRNDNFLLFYYLLLFLFLFLFLEFLNVARRTRKLEKNMNMRRVVCQKGKFL
jgi:hypothetical protein